jgi:hypothetical protein
MNPGDVRNAEKINGVNPIMITANFATKRKSIIE